MAFPGRTDAPKPIQVTPHNDVLPRILVKQIVLGNFSRPLRSVRSRSAVAQAASAIKPGTIGVDGRFLRDTSAGDVCGRGRAIALSGSGVLEVLRRREVGYALGACVRRIAVRYLHA